MLADDKNMKRTTEKATKHETKNGEQHRNKDTPLAKQTVIRWNPMKS